VRSWLRDIIGNHGVGFARPPGGQKRPERKNIAGASVPPLLCFFFVTTFSGIR